MLRLFHITPLRNLQSILKKGLMPGYTKGLGCRLSEENRARIWLTDDPEFILQTQAGDSWIRRNSPVILSINCTSLDVISYISYYTHMSNTINHEFYVLTTISPDLIQLFTKEQYV